MAYEEGSDKLVKAYKKATPGEAVDPADKGEYDNEGQMAKTQLRGIVADASHMIQMFSDEQNLPEWVQNKITKSADYLNSAHRYMMNKEDTDEAVDFMSAGKYATVMHPKTRKLEKILKTDLKKYVMKGYQHMGPIKNRVTKSMFEETIEEKAGKYSRRGDKELYQWGDINQAMMDSGLNMRQILKVMTALSHARVGYNESVANEEKVPAVENKKVTGKSFDNVRNGTTNESDAEWEKSLEKQKFNRLSRKDQETFKKLMALMNKEKGKKK